MAFWGEEGQFDGMARHLFSLLCFLGCLVQATFSQSVPGLINDQGRVAVGGVNFDGSGLQRSEAGGPAWTFVGRGWIAFA